MSRSMITSLATALLVFTGMALGQQTGPLTPPAMPPTGPTATAEVNPVQLYHALRALDKHVTCRITDDKKLCFFTLHLHAAGELRPVVVDLDIVKHTIKITMPLSMPFSTKTHPISPDLADRMRVLNRDLAPCEFDTIPTELGPDSWELVTVTVLKKPVTLPEFQARLKLILESVAKTKPIWSTFPQ